ncbi:Membrane magnesium transporter [Rhizoctonia solani]|uniref:Membrane magnesium transporter n=1 Tax=Rhizoctonia solani TaxID=456999 RepID=A0A8H7IHP9_9AGAM|nr:Membrane magnesium transporter [Rhizoctonia solani]
MVSPAYSAYEHLSLLKALDRPSRVPIDVCFPGLIGVDSDCVQIAIESILAFAVFLFGVSLSSSELKEISWASEMRHRKIDDVHSRLGFASFNHRGKQLYGGKAPAE